MVEYALNLDAIFFSLADPTRRDILRRVGESELSVGEIAQHYQLTFAAVSKHLKVLEKAALVIKRRRGKEQMVRLAPQAFIGAAEYLDWYKPLWTDKLDSLEIYLKESDH
jgi:DNA-binding transcriptional ArsR family regulator